MFLLPGLVSTSNCVFTVTSTLLQHYLSALSPLTCSVNGMVYFTKFDTEFYNFGAWMRRCACVCVCLCDVWVTCIPVIFVFITVPSRLFFFFFLPDKLLSVNALLCKSDRASATLSLSAVVNVDIVVPIMTFVLYVCQRMVCTVMYASRQ